MPLTSLHCVGLSFRTAPVAVRERVAIDERGVRRMLEAVASDPAVRGAAVLSTCGRTELYVDVRGSWHATRSHVERVLADAAGMGQRELGRHLYAHDGVDAARHLSRVAAGLDSAVPGEPEILGQVSAAWRMAKAASTASGLGRLFEAAIRSGRRARRETGINRQATGLAAVCVRVAAEHFGSLADSHVMVLGGGRMGQATLRALQKVQVGRLTIASRRIETAIALAQRSEAHACCLSGFRALLPEADVVITATAAPAPILDRDLIEQAVAGRPERPLFVADLGLPRNVDGAVAEVAGVTLHDLDALKLRVDSVLETRRGEIPRVESIIEEELALLEKRERQAQARPAIRTLRRVSEHRRREALAEALAHLPALDPVAERHLDSVTRRVVDRVLRHPTSTLLAAAETGDAAQLILVLNRLFGLEGADCSAPGEDRAPDGGAVDMARADTRPVFSIAPLP